MFKYALLFLRALFLSARQNRRQTASVQLFTTLKAADQIRNQYWGGDACTTLIDVHLFISRKDEVPAELGGKGATALQYANESLKKKKKVEKPVRL